MRGFSGFFGVAGAAFAAPAVVMAMVVAMAVWANHSHAAAAEAGGYEEIAAGVYAHRGAVANPQDVRHGDISNTGFIIGEKGVLVIDSGGSRATGEALLAAVEAATSLPVIGLVLTHMHPDHVFGVAAFEERGITIYGHYELPRALADRADSYRNNYLSLLGEAESAGSTLPRKVEPVAEVTVIDLGGREVEMMPWAGVAHTNNDLTVFDRKTGVLFTGDLLFHDHIPAIDGSIRGWQKVMEAMAALPVQMLVPGHGDAGLEFPQGLAAQKRYFDVLIADTRESLDAGDRISAAVGKIGQSEAAAWSLFDDFNPRNATVVFGELEWE